MNKAEFILSTIQPMAEHTFPYLTSIIGVSDSQTGQHIGSGLRCVFGGRRAVATALHVIDDARKCKGGIAISKGYGSPPYQVHGKVSFDAAGDLALYYLPDDFPFDNRGVAFWPETRIQLSDDRLTTDYLFVHGFPEAHSRFFHLINGVASKSLPYGVMQRLDGLPADLQPFQFALDFDPTNMHSLGDQNKVDFFVDPLGLSGSPVWRIGISGGTSAAWSPVQSLVVGFVTQWRPSEKILVATLASRLSQIGH